MTLNEQNTLADANLLAFMVDNAKEDFRSKLEQKLLHNQYGSMQEVTDDIKKMLYESGPVKAVFYCPLVGEVTDDEGFSSPVDGRFLKSYDGQCCPLFRAERGLALQAVRQECGIAHRPCVGLGAYDH